MTLNYIDDFDFETTSETVAWQKEYAGAWSKTHYTADRGKTTLCGTVVPDSATTDSSGNQGRCKRCVQLKKEAK